MNWPEAFVESAPWLFAAVGVGGFFWMFGKLIAMDIDCLPTQERCDCPHCQEEEEDDGCEG